jgi:hypothetical protein
VSRIILLWRLQMDQIRLTPDATSYWAGKGVATRAEVAALPEHFAIPIVPRGFPATFSGKTMSRPPPIDDPH